MSSYGVQASPPPAPAAGQAQYFPPPPQGGQAPPHFPPPPPPQQQQQYFPPPPVSPPASQQHFGPPAQSPPPSQQYFNPPPNPTAPQPRFSPPPPPGSTVPPSEHLSYHGTPPPASHHQVQQYAQPHAPGGNVGHHANTSPSPFHGPPTPGLSPNNSQQTAPHPSYPPEKMLEIHAPASSDQSSEKLGLAAARTQQLNRISNAFNSNSPAQTPGGAPSKGPFIGVGTTQDDVGTFNGGSYRISHRDTNTVITIQLAMGCPISAKPGVMIAMSPSITLVGSVKFSLWKVLIGSDLTVSTFTGPGELLLAPLGLGDITSLRLSGSESWSVSKDAFLAATQGVVKSYEGQGLVKGMFSREGFFVYKMSGNGILWMTSFGAILRKELAEGEKYIVDNGYLVAWNCEYVLEQAASGGIVSNFASREGLVCKFTGPGTVFLQTRNPGAFALWLKAHGRARG